MVYKVKSAQLNLVAIKLKKLNYLNDFNALFKFGLRILCCILLPELNYTLKVVIQKLVFLKDNGIFLE